MRMLYTDRLRATDRMFTARAEFDTPSGNPDVSRLLP